MKVYLAPHVSQIDPATGIGRVVIAQHKYLQNYDIELVDDLENADVTAVHTQDFGIFNPDVVHTHGLYWTGDPGSGAYANWHHTINKRIIESIRRARKITVPSNWVAMPFKRDMRISPVVIGHGIDFDEWGPGENRKYVLWNKNRDVDVCDPAPAWELAERGIQVVSTFKPKGGLTPDSMAVVGRVSFEDMKKLIADADVYLATTKETFGIGTLEAMACGVPVLGYSWGGTLDLITHKEDGYLVDPGDIEGLLRGLEYIRKNRKRMSIQARVTAKLYGWKNVIGKYAELYRSVNEPEPNGVAIVIPNFNYGEYIVGAVESAIHQVHPVKEIIVVDDGSTDDSLSILHKNYKNNSLVKIIAQENQGVASARNKGISATQQPFIVCLDADDMLDPHFIQVCQDAMINDRGLGIAYTGITLEQGYGWESYTAWPPEFDWGIQASPHNPPQNCIPSGSMFRRSMWERAGGYRQAYAPAEDTEFWTRGLSTGFTAQKVTREGLFMYRAHPGSASRTKEYKQIDAWLPWMKDKQFPLAAPTKESTLIRSYSTPEISVIIPVGPGHGKYLSNAIESVIGQTFGNWEIIVIDDTYSHELVIDENILRSYPFVNLITPPGNIGAGAARNEGLKAAKSPLVLFLDADDYIMPDALKLMLHKFNLSNGEYVYTDYIRGKVNIELPEYKPELLIEGLIHAVTVLMKRSDAQIIGGFDEDLISWEDWDFFAKCAANKIYGVRLQEFLLVYKAETGRRRETALQRKKELHEVIKSRYELILKKDTEAEKCLDVALVPAET
jgi:glycosyltransferase involved in cell wall biosynthesis